MKRKILGLLGAAILCTSQCFAVTLPKGGEVYAYVDGDMKDLTDGTDTGLGIIDAYDEKTDTYIHFDDEEIWAENLLYKVDEEGCEELMISEEQLKAWGEKGYSLESVQDGKVYTVTFKYGPHNELLRNLRVVDIKTNQILKTYNVSNNENYIVICNGRIFYDKKINGTLAVVENVNNKETKLLNGLPVGYYKDYLFIEQSSKSGQTIYAYNINTKQKVYMAALGENDSILFDKTSNFTSKALYYIKADKVYKAVPGAKSVICDIKDKKIYGHQLNTVEETATDYYINFLSFTDKEGKTEFLKVSKNDKQMTKIFESKIIRAYMPYLFYVNNVRIDTKGKVYYNAPLIENPQGSTPDVHAVGHIYDTKAKKDMKQNDPWSYIFQK